MLRLISLLALLFALPLLAAPLGATIRGEEKPPERDVSHYNLDKSGLALGGYDPVAYFPEGGSKAAKGDAKITTTHKGVTYRFATTANRDLFLKDPAKFEPQFGGWCAYAIPEKEKVEIDPESFVVHEGKLYVFFKAWYNDTRAKWQKSPADFIQRGDAAWKDITSKPLPKK